MSKRFLKINEVCYKVAFSRDKVYRMIRAGEFPKPTKVGGNSVRWTEEDVDRWIDEKICENSAIQ